MVQRSLGLGGTAPLEIRKRPTGALTGIAMAMSEMLGNGRYGAAASPGRDVAGIGENLVRGSRGFRAVMTRDGGLMIPGAAEDRRRQLHLFGL